ncbi:MAG: hypothetical protein HY301_02665 [Verrucomicrobia bacterium]|nr:hypothetical protein [Verrucomicrobiota bacterium]
MPLERHKLDDFTRGWFVGNFSPTLVNTDAFEVAVQRYRAGDREPRHVHKIASELTVIIVGRARMNGEELGPGDIVRLKPGEPANFEAITDATTLAVKIPCVKGDKYLCDDAAGHAAPPLTKQ